MRQISITEYKDKVVVEIKDNRGGNQQYNFDNLEGAIEKIPSLIGLAYKRGRRYETQRSGFGAYIC